MADDGGRAARNNRTAMSCDRCKGRKTKCKNPVPGPCDYCRSIDATCQIDVRKRRQRPYYFVSEEEYRHMQKILRHYLPDKDLTLPNLRQIASKCEEKGGRDAVQFSVDRPTVFNPEVASKRDDKSQEAEMFSAQSEEDDALVEIVHLHEDIGCMLADARGEYRYIGAESGVSFNSAVRTWKTESPQAGKDKDIIPPMSKVTLPLAASKSTTVVQLFGSLLLPARDVCLHWVSRYFEEVHCLHWLYSSEQFHTRLEATYVDQEKSPSYSWMCSLYCIFALGALGTSTPNSSAETPAAGDYLDMAKSMVSRVCDEADLDSVRAIILLALALQSHGFSNSAYLYTGLAVRIAFSLGLHLDKYSTTYGPVEKEHARRIWWALYLFDQEVALRTGKPCLTGAPSEISWQPPLPSEQILNPGPHTPSGYLRVSIALTQLTKIARDTVYIKPTVGGTKLSLPKVGTVLSSLREWLACVPRHLSSTAPTAPLHERPVAILHVRYWSVVILVSRPFLLCSLLRRKQLQQNSKLRYFEELSSICLNAAEQSLTILRKMTEDRLLSSVVVSDFYYILDLFQVFLIAFALDRSEKHLLHARNCVEVLQSMGSFGLCQKMLPEVLHQLTDWGVLHGAVENPTNLQEFDMSLMGMEAGNEFYDMLFNANDPSDNTTADMFFPDIDFNDMDFIDGTTSDELLQQIMGTSQIPSASSIA